MFRNNIEAWSRSCNSDEPPMHIIVQSLLGVVLFICGICSLPPMIVPMFYIFLAALALSLVNLGLRLGNNLKDLTCAQRRLWTTYKAMPPDIKSQVSLDVDSLVDVDDRAAGKFIEGLETLESLRSRRISAESKVSGAVYKLDHALKHATIDAQRDVRIAEDNVKELL